MKETQYYIYQQLRPMKEGKAKSNLRLAFLQNKIQTL
jgi:hypothetical protein